MKFFRLLAFALVFTSALRAEQNLPVAGAPFDVIVPDGWVRIPDKALARVRQHIPGVQVSNVAAFLGPRSSPNTPLTVLLVQAIEPEITSQAYLDYARASLAADLAEDPGVKMMQDSCQLGINGRAVIASYHTNDGRAWRTYAFPSSEGIFLFFLHCPAANAPITFAAIESCLSRLRFVAGATIDAQWLAELKKILPPAPKRTY